MFGLPWQVFTAFVSTFLAFSMCMLAFIGIFHIDVYHVRTANEIEQIYKNNNLDYTYKKYSKKQSIDSLIPHLKNDKKNNDEKINFILLKKIGKTTLPNNYKISISNIKKLTRFIAQY